MKPFILLLTTCLLAVSCSKQSFISIDDPAQTNRISVRLVIKTPGTTLPTKSAEMDHENQINEIQILVFEDGKYSYRVPGISLSSSGSTTSFNALLSVNDQSVKLYLVANSSSAITANEPQPGETPEAVKARLNLPFTPDGINQSFPMFGEYDLPDGITAKVVSLDGIKMVRGIARVDVVRSDEASDFTLTSIQLFRANNLIQAIPGSSGASVPETSTQNVNTAALSVAGNLSEGQVYLPESSIPANKVSGATCVVVGGKIADGVVTYYRMDFHVSEESLTGQILRNYRYVFNIKRVSGLGWTTPEDAANNRSSHITVEVQAWDEHTSDMYFDGDSHFGVSVRELSFDYRDNRHQDLYINTNLESYTMQWADESGNPLGAVADELLGERFTVTSGLGGTVLSVVTLQRNGYDDPLQKAYVLLTAGRWKILLTLRQLPRPVSVRPINVLSFNAGLGYFGSNVTLPQTAAEGRGNGARGILTNTDNFGPTGTVRFGGFNLIFSNVAYNALTDRVFAHADIVYLHYMANGLFGTSDTQRVLNWLAANPNRVLVVSFDASGVNQYIRSVMGMTDISYYSINSGAFPLAETGTYFTDSGPFTENSPIPSSFSFRCFDVYRGEIATSYTNITPILMGPKGGITMGVDYSNRIVYMGDVDLFNAAAGTGATSENRINNTTGVINNDASRLIANLWAWMAEVVLDEE